MARVSLQFVAMSLTGAALLSISAAPQEKQGSRLAEGSHSVQKENPVSFEVLSIRPLSIMPSSSSGLSQTSKPAPGGYASALSIWQAIQLAYAPEFNLVSGSRKLLNAPAWAGDMYAFDGRISKADLKAWQDQRRQPELLAAAMQAALKERCKLAIHEKPATLSILELVIGKRGSRLKAASPVAAGLRGIELPSGGICPPIRKGKREMFDFRGATVGDLVWFLQRLSREVPIRDRTGLAGRYDFTLEEILEPSHSERDAVNNYPIDHLGLRLRRAAESRPILVIDHIEKPTAN